jgi:hypothetical protein
VAVGELLVVEAHQVQDGGVQVVDADLVVHCRGNPRFGLSDRIGTLPTQTTFTAARGGNRVAAMGPIRHSAGEFLAICFFFRAQCEPKLSPL